MTRLEKLNKAGTIAGTIGRIIEIMLAFVIGRISIYLYNEYNFYMCIVMILCGLALLYIGANIIEEIFYKILYSLYKKYKALDEEEKKA